MRALAFPLAALLLAPVGESAIALEPRAAKPSAVEPSVAAQEEILSVVDAFFIAMANKDKAAMAATASPEAIMVLTADGSGTPALSRMPLSKAIERFGEGSNQGRVRETYWSPTVLQRADIAVVWTPYRIDVDGERRHCGVDVFNLSREGQIWLIDAISFTMEPEACAELEPEGVVARPSFNE